MSGPALSPRSWPGWQEVPLPWQMPGTSRLLTAGGSGRNDPRTPGLGENCPRARPALFAAGALMRAAGRTEKSGRSRQSTSFAGTPGESVQSCSVLPPCQPGLLCVGVQTPCGPDEASASLSDRREFQAHPWLRTLCCSPHGPECLFSPARGLLTRVPGLALAESSPRQTGGQEVEGAQFLMNLDITLTSSPGPQSKTDVTPCLSPCGLRPE